MTSTLNQKTQPTPTPSRRRRWIGLSIAALFIAGVAFGLIYFFGGTEPAEVDLDATVNAVTATTAGDSSAATATSTPTSPVVDDMSGDWAVDTTTGTFSFEDATATFAGFRVEEELASIGATTAVGRSPEVFGAVTIDGTSITSAEFAVDLTAIVSD